ncbi:MAG: hypothetical protein HY694_05340 [Deltaproteobacteria bacterium]|nr:hypothetical protein [Deltaproteobacteria bacterium]
MKAPLPLVGDDERAVALENASYRWGFQVFSYALLIDLIFRGLVRQEVAWDLMAIIGLAGAVSFAYQARHKILHPQWMRRVCLIVATSGLGAALMVLGMKLLH